MISAGVFLSKFSFQLVGHVAALRLDTIKAQQEVDAHLLHLTDDGHFSSAVGLRCGVVWSV